MPRRRCRAAVLVSAMLLLVALPHSRAGTGAGHACELPPAISGTTGHVLLRFMVLGGKVNFIKPLFVVSEPPDRADALLEAIRGCLKASTYSSLPVPPGQSVEILQAFHFFAPVRGGNSVELADGRRVSRVHVEEMRTLRLQLAGTLLEGSDYVEIKETGWILRTNVNRRERVAVIDAIRAGVQSFAGLFPGATPLDGSSELAILLFESEEQFNQVAAFDRIFRGPQPAGQYTIVDQTAYSFVSRRDRPLRMSIEVLVHEVTHHLIHQGLATGQREVPFWVDEGIASFIALLQPAKGKPVDLAAFVRGKQKQTGYQWFSPASVYLEAVETRRKAEPALDLDAILVDQQQELDAETAYGLAWVLVHYLINGEDGVMRELFESWLITSMGTPGDDGLPSALGRTTEQLEAGLFRHLAMMPH